MRFIPEMGIGSRIALIVVAGLAGGCSSSESADDGPHDASQADEPERNARLLAVSPTHGCALREAGLYCWGRNFEAQLGNGGQEDSLTAVMADVSGEEIAEVATSTGRTCVRLHSGKVGCWGGNAHGQIGDGTRERATELTMTLGIDDARQLAIDGDSTCVLRADRAVDCWGRSPGGAPDEGSLSPRPIEGLAGAVELHSGAGDTYCARGEQGWVRCARFENGAWTSAAPVEPLFGATAIGLTFSDELCGIMPSTEILCSNLDSGNTVALDDSGGSLELEASGGLAACAKNMDGQWSCWNVLPSMLESVGSPKISAPADMPLLEFAVSGFNICTWRRDDSVACVNANDANLEPHVVEGLPP